MENSDSSERTHAEEKGELRSASTQVSDLNVLDEGLSDEENASNGAHEVAIIPPDNTLQGLSMQQMRDLARAHGMEVRKGASKVQLAFALAHRRNSLTQRAAEARVSLNAPTNNEDVSQHSQSVRCIQPPKSKRALSLMTASDAPQQASSEGKEADIKVCNPSFANSRPLPNFPYWPVPSNACGLANGQKFLAKSVGTGGREEEKAEKKEGADPNQPNCPLTEKESATKA